MEQHSVICLATEEFERRYVRPRKGRTLIAGSRIYPGREDRRRLYENAEGWDALPGDGVNRVVDLESAVPVGEQFAHIECISVLEHSRRPWLLARSIEQLMCVGGTLHLTVPFIWRVHAYPDDFWRFTASGLRALFSRITWERVMYASVELLEEKKKVPAAWFADHLFMARTEVCAFGARQ